MGKMRVVAPLRARPVIGPRPSWMSRADRGAVGRGETDSWPGRWPRGTARRGSFPHVGEDAIEGRIRDLGVDDQVTVGLESIAIVLVEDHHPDSPGSEGIGYPLFRPIRPAFCRESGPIPGVGLARPRPPVPPTDRRALGGRATSAGWARGRIRRGSAPAPLPRNGTGRWLPGSPSDLRYPARPDDPRWRSDARREGSGSIRSTDIPPVGSGHWPGGSRRGRPGPGHPSRGGAPSR